MMEGGLLRIGILGCGAFVRRYHMPALLETPNVETTAICHPQRLLEGAL
jgi:predicted dehydrogenase